MKRLLLILLVFASSLAAQVSFVGSASVPTGTKTNSTFTLTAGTGQTILLYLDISGGTPTAPVGFTPAPGFPTSTSNGTTSVSHYLWWKTAGPSETGTYTVTHPSAITEGWLGVYSGADPNSPLVPNPTTASGTGTTTTALGLTTSRANSMAIFISSDFAYTLNHLSPPASYTARYNGSAVFVADNLYASAGATGNQSITNNSSSSDPWAGFLIAVQPIAGSAHSVNLNWVLSTTTSPAITSENIYRAVQGCPSPPPTVTGQSPFALIASVGPAIETYQDQSVNSGATYCYYITALNANGESAPSNDVQAIIPISGSPAATLSTTSLSFGNQTTGTTSASESTTLTNTGTANLTISGISLAGTNPSDFTESNNCPSSVAPNASCTITVTFTPASASSFTASIAVNDNASGSPQTISLSGTGVAPNITLNISPTSLTFPTTGVGSTSPSQSVTFTANGNQAVAQSGIQINGANPNDFAAVNNCPSTIAVNQSCSVTLTFTPTASGSRTANLQMVDNATGSPQTITLSGTGSGSGGHQWYVSKSGSDSNACTQAAPCLTIGHGFTVVTPGDTLHVLPGSYNESGLNFSTSCTSAAPCTVVSDTQYGAVIAPVSNASTQIMTVTGPFVTINGFEVNGANSPGACVGINANAPNVTLMRMKVHDIPGNVANLCSSNGGAGIDLQDNPNNVVDQNIVYNVGLEASSIPNSAFHGIYLNGNGSIVTNNLSFNNMSWGFHSGGATVENMLVYNNTAFGNQQGGFMLWSGNCTSASVCGNNTYANNIAYKNAAFGFTELPSGVGLNARLYTNNLTFGNSSGDYNLSTGGTTGISATNQNQITGLDPQFVNPTGDITGNYQTKSTSPAVDAGFFGSTPTAPPTINHDLLGNPRPDSGGAAIVDIGAYEFQATTQVVAVSISPLTATVTQGQTQQFTATVTGATNTAVTWSATGGTVSSSGLYTAPTTGSGTFMVTATSVADTTKSASAQVTVNSPIITVSVVPATASISQGQTQQFLASVTGTSNTAVTWSVTGGTISSGGLYTAPSNQTGNFTVTATSVANPSVSASSTITVFTVPNPPPAPPPPVIQPPSSPPPVQACPITHV